MRKTVLIIVAAFAALLAAGCSANAATPTAPAAATTQAAAVHVAATTTPVPTNAAGTPGVPAHAYTAAQDRRFLAELAGNGLDYPAGEHRDGILLIGHAMADVLNAPGTTLTPDELTNGMARGFQNQNPPLPKYVIGEVVAAVVNAYTDR